MSIYQHLSMPIPTIAYCAIHQALPEVPKDEYLKTMKELHARIAAETESINTGYKKFIAEAITRETTMLKGTLSQFLQTPFKSDTEEIRRILGESFEKFKDQLLDGRGFGLSQSVEGRVFFSPSRKAVERKLLQNGKAYLEELGFAGGKGKGEIFESMFIIHGGVNLDILEHIVRDKLGIYATTHGKHIKEFGSYSYAAYNRVYSKGDLPPKKELGKFVEIAIFFSKPDIKYAPFRSGLADAFEKLCRDLAIDHLSLWQRKLGLGGGKEFVLRIVGNSSDKISQSIQWLDSYKEKPFVRESLIVDGRLVVKDLLF
ncbi:MAG TPA: hypothetical protein VFG32_10830 [Bacteroidota bacterium]|nr:hypothetical protein [Bacteroidota bacterium]